MSILIPKKIHTEFKDIIQGQNIKNSNIIQDKNVKIPKIIHQTYISFKKIPKNWVNTPTSWKMHNPQWEYKFWSDEDNRKLCQEKFPWFLETYDSYKYPIQRADAVRYMILYTYGGVYIDLEYYCQKPIDIFFIQESELYLLNSPNDNIFSSDTITNSFMASKKGSKFWIYLLEKMVEYANNPSPLWLTKHIYVMYTTGPACVTKCFRNYSEINSVSFLPQNLLFPSKCNVCSEKPCTTDEAYIVVLEGSSWCDSDSDFLKRTYCNPKLFLTVVSIGILIIIYFIYYKQ